MAGKHKKSSRKVLEKRWQSLGERGSAAARQRRLPVLARSRTYDPSFCKEGEEEASAGGQGGPASSLGKRAASFRKLFGSVAAREVLLGCFSCAWQKEVPYHGRLYISAGYVCFHCSLLLKDIKAVVPVPSISALKKTNTVLLVPNALSIRTTDGEKFLFVSLRRREATFRLLQSLCGHLQDNGAAGSPPASPLSGSTQQILKKPLTSSQSDLEQSTLELGSLPEAPDGPRSRPSQAEDGDGVPALGTGGPRAAAQTTTRDWLSQSFLNTIIIIYLLLPWHRPLSKVALAAQAPPPPLGHQPPRPLLALAPALALAARPSPCSLPDTALSPNMVALLLSSGYIGLRIADLEQQLTALGAWPDFNLQHP